MEKFMEKELYRNIETLLNYEDFTSKEKQIVELVSHGLSNKQIADDLGISITTVRTHLKTIYLKTYLDINTEKYNIIHRVRLILFYLKFKGILDPKWNIDIS